MSEFLRLYEKIVKICSLESMSHELNRRLGESCTSDDISALIEQLESLNDADLVNDAGDIGDFYGRLRTSISDALAASGQKAVSPLLSTLSSSNERAAQYAARSLGLLKSKQAIEPIIKKMQAVTENSDKLSYIEALGNIGDSCIIDVLLPHLSRSGEQNGGWLVCISAIALGKTGDESVLNPLVDLLREDFEWLARIGAAEGLGILGSRNGLPALLNAIGDPDYRVAEAARKSINQIHSRILRQP